MIDFWIFIAGALIFGAILFLTIQRRRRGFSAKEKSWAVSRWKEIETTVGKNPEHAVLEADKLCDWAISRCGYRGSFAEKSKKAQALFSSYDDVRKAHRLRNRIAHDLDARVSENESRRALAAFRAALKDLRLF